MVVTLVALDIILTCPRGVERQVELVFPPELEARLAHGVVAHLCAGMSLGQVGGVSGYLVGYHAVAHILEIGEGKMFLGVT